jgi:hypothetical protein
MAEILIKRAIFLGEEDDVIDRGQTSLLVESSGHSLGSCIDCHLAAAGAAA